MNINQINLNKILKNKIYHKFINSAGELIYVKNHFQQRNNSIY